MDKKNVALNAIFTCECTPWDHQEGRTERSSLRREYPALKRIDSEIFTFSN